MVESSMTFLPRIALTALLSVVGSAHSSVEKNLEVATEMTCEQLLHDATTLYGSITEIEYAISFALEERNWISERAKVSSEDPELRTELHAINLKISRTIAMHRLFQKPTCPVERDWYRYKPIKIGKNSLWD